MTAWDWLRGDAGDEDRVVQGCQDCGAALSGDQEAGGPAPNMQAVGPLLGLCGR